MERTQVSGTITGVVMAAVLLTGCGPREEPRTPPPGGGSSETVQATGTVQFVALEGGFYGIVAEDGTRYDPINLPPQFQRDGQRIRFEGKVRSDLAGIHMWGTLIEITQISAL
ncbi:MAG: hypothetical protein HY321_04710 [Armatimonadetes bacterium]|nr:hypothetical protein [Armatimonadota bacterium]